MQLEKTADVLRKLHWFPREMTPEKQAQKVHTEDVGSTLIGQSKYISHVASPVGIRMRFFAWRLYERSRNDPNSFNKISPESWIQNIYESCNVTVAPTRTIQWYSRLLYVQMYD